MVGAYPWPQRRARGTCRGPPPRPSSRVGLREFWDQAGKVTRCCSFVLLMMGTPLTTTLHLPCGVTVTFPSRLVKEACLSEILKKQEFV